MITHITSSFCLGKIPAIEKTSRLNVPQDGESVPWNAGTRASEGLGGGSIVPKKCRISGIIQPGDPSRNFYNLNFELYLEHHLQHLQQLSDSLEVKGTYHFFFLALQTTGWGLDYYWLQLPFTSLLCIFYAGRHFQKLFKSIKGLTCIPILLTAIMQSVRRFPWLSLKSAKFCWLARRCALQLPSGLGHRTQLQKGILKFSPQWNICLFCLKNDTC